jgi:alpha-tubulin suppressor-like RCC1 family protein
MNPMPSSDLEKSPTAWSILRCERPFHVVIASHKLQTPWTLLLLLLVSSTAVCQSGTPRITAGANHTLLLKADGTLWSWGYNHRGQLGDGSTVSKEGLVRVGTSNDWADVVAGAAHTVGLKLDGSLWAWGSNGFGELGDGTTTTQNTPIQVGIAHDWTAIAAGAGHTLALKRDGRLWSWGRNNVGQLGDGSASNRIRPVPVPSHGDWVAVMAGNSHTVALKRDGTLWSWGSSRYGQLGLGGHTFGAVQATPKQVGSETDWAKIAANGDHSAAIKLDGQLWAWGLNTSGQVGDGSSGNARNAPVQTRSTSAWSAIVLGGAHALALKGDGSLWAWGANTSGQLGDGSLYMRNTPFPVGFTNTVLSVGAGDGHSVALLDDGSLWTWGNKTAKTAGPYQREWRTVPALVPVQAPSASPRVAEIAGGSEHSLAITLDGTLWAWGKNSFGQLGNGTTNVSPIPIVVGLTNDWKSRHRWVSSYDGHQEGWDPLGVGLECGWTNCRGAKPAQASPHAGGHCPRLDGGRGWTISLCRTKD